MTLDGDIQFVGNSSKRIDVGGAYGSLNLGGSGQLSLRTYSSGWQDRLFIKTNGNVGINTTDANEKLEVNGKIKSSGTNSALILVSPNGTEFEITVDDQGNLTTSELTTINKTNNNNDIVIYPNPTIDNLIINCNSNIIQQMITELYDISGMLVYKRSFESNSAIINLKNHEIGTYILIIKDEKGSIIKSEKIIKE